MANEGLDLLADGFSFLELPRWHEGRLWAADMFAGQVVAFAADGAAHVVITVPEVLAGFGWMPDGSLLTARKELLINRSSARYGAAPIAADRTRARGARGVGDDEVGDPPRQGFRQFVAHAGDDRR